MVEILEIDGTHGSGGGGSTIARDRLTLALGPVGDSSVDPLPVQAATSASALNSATAPRHRRTAVNVIEAPFVCAGRAGS
jgi:hypothetical protein